ncbi:MAG TPA: hypothetical protein VNQ76_10945 [Planctomicrobium sp.]|nr:hypothetical protein [Planctomicrobium sp.]
MNGHLMRRLLQEEHGSIDTMVYVLMTTLLAIGGITGLATLRDGIVQEYADIGWALLSLDQSYTYTIPGPGGPITVNHGTSGVGQTPVVVNGRTELEPTGISDTGSGFAPHGISLSTAGTPEGGTQLAPVPFVYGSNLPGHTSGVIPAGFPGASEDTPLPP